MKKFEKISMRGLGAYAICCLEKSLKFFNLRSAGWDFILENLWKYTSTPFFSPLRREQYNLDELYLFHCQLMEYNISPFVEKRLGTKSNKLVDLSDEQITMLYNMYKEADKGIINITSAVFEVLYCECFGGSEYPFFMTFEAIDKLNKLLNKNLISLPDIAMFKKHTFDPRCLEAKYASIFEDGAEYGQIFNGKELYSE